MQRPSYIITKVTSVNTSILVDLYENIHIGYENDINNSSNGDPFIPSQ